MLNHVVRQVPVVLCRISANGFQGRQRLKSKFAHEARILLTISTEGLGTMPHIPVVRISPIVAVRIFKGRSRGRRTEPVGCIGIQFSHPRGQCFIEESFISLSIIIPLFGVPSPGFPAHIHFIIAAPQCQAGAMSDTPHIIYYFLMDILHKRFVMQRVNTAGKCKILPDKESILITKIIKIFTFIEAAAPHTDHIMVCSGSITQQLVQLAVCDSCRKGICWNPV